MERYKKAKADYEYLVKHHGEHANDLTGGYVEGDAYFELLSNPTKKNAYQHYCSLITHYAVSGVEDYQGGAMPDFDDEEVCRIFRDNGDVRDILAHWNVDIGEFEDYD